MNYIVVAHSDIEAFQAVVNKHLSDGYRLAGGVSIGYITINGNQANTYIQALIKP